MRGWIPLDLGPIAPNGVQRVDLSAFAPESLRPITSAAHVYVGELEGLKTLAIAFRGTDEGDREFAFQGGYDPTQNAFGWDAYAAAHAPSSSPHCNTPLIRPTASSGSCSPGTAWAGSSPSS